MSSLSSTCHRRPPARFLPTPSYPNWQAAAADAVRNPDVLCRLLELPPSLHTIAIRAAGSFPLLVPRTYLSRIRIGDPQDPLLLQILPGEGELLQSPQFTADPVGEVDATRDAGVLGKYQGRLLMVTTGVCAVHCRFCFRRHFPYPGIVSGRQRWTSALDQIAANTSVHEVILSGGDPLSLDDAILAPLIGRLETIKNVRRLRIHTRQPVVIPQRITSELLAMLHSSRFTVLMVLHLNHPAEIDGPLASAIGRLVDAGISVLQQGVLLRGVNDRIDVLVELCQRLVDLRVMPYYLHQLDRVAGAAHFEVSEATGIHLIQQLRTRLPGYAVPRYVREIAGAPSKTVLA